MEKIKAIELPEGWLDKVITDAIHKEKTLPGWLNDNPVLPDDDEPITFDWVASNFPSMGPQYSARRHRDLPSLVWQNRFERFTLYNDPQCHLKTRGDVRRLVAALGVPSLLDKPPNAKDRQYEWLEIENWD